MTISYEEALQTLQSIFSPQGYTQQQLDSILRQHSGHMENTVECILDHGDELFHSEKEEDDNGDIEQGIITSENTDGSRSSSWAAAAVARGTSTNSNVDEDAAPVPLAQQVAGMELREKDDVASIEQGTSTNFTSTATTWLPGGLENVDEDAAPVPLIQQVAGMELREKDDVASIEQGTSTNFTSTATSWLPGGLENVDEDAAPVPLIQKIAAMEIEKDDVASIEHASKPSQSLTPAVMLEQIEDGDDDAPPRPFNSAEFEDESKPSQIDLGEDSTDEDDGPPLPLVYQQDSLTDAKMEAAPQISVTNSVPNNRVSEASTAAAVDGNESSGGGPSDNSKSQDENDGLSEQGQDSPDVEHVASGGGADAIDRFEDRLKRKMAEGSKTTAATAELHHSDQDESDAYNEQGRFIASENTNTSRPFNSVEFEDESKPQIDFGEDSTDEDDGPPLPLVYQQDSLTDAKVEAASLSLSRGAAAKLLIV